ncbi:L-dopachrome tautomerase-related protein [uncultured Bacteroides sp.]|uniref:L-dopachrome tautomerase-related protein n=1 Tax=uncultured Bacteroides sp. TaxID=162156 RepID=UPI0025E9FAB9|nr:L-dopachrome tautomerase-related protein [uncultured Bacteroides sp.]
MSNLEQNRMEEVVSFKGIQVTGITICEKGRMFVNFPRWRDGVPFSVAEVMKDGSHKPYPDKEINTWENGDEIAPDKFVCVQSVVAYMGKLYVLDTKNPSMKQVLDVPTIYVYDLPTDKLIRTYKLADSTKQSSYTNDLRVDDKAGKIYLTDSGAPGLIVVDIESGENYRVLDGHPFTTAEVNHINAGGKGYDGTIHSDGIALDRKNDILYFHALTGYTLYGIPTSQLINREIDEDKIFRMKTPSPDGMIMDKDGNLYMGDLENSAVVYLTSDREEIHTLVKGGNISWPDTFAIYEDELYFTNSRIHEAVGDISEMSFPVDKVKLPR